MKKLIYALGILTSSIILVLGMSLLDGKVDDTYRAWAGVIMTVTHGIVVIACLVSFRLDLMNQCNHEYADRDLYGKIKCVKCGKLKGYSE
jgi:hypothetical protein